MLHLQQLGANGRTPAANTSQSTSPPTAKTPGAVSTKSSKHESLKVSCQLTVIVSVKSWSDSKLRDQSNVYIT